MEEGQEITWTTFEDELWGRFGPTDGVNFDETLSKIRQQGTLREYQQEFGKLRNWVEGWSHKALVGSFMGGLKPEIAEDIRLFRPRTLKDAILLARIKDEQLIK